MKKGIEATTVLDATEQPTAAESATQGSRRSTARTAQLSRIPPLIPSRVMAWRLSCGKATWYATIVSRAASIRAHLRAAASSPAPRA